MADIIILNSVFQFLAKQTQNILTHFKHKISKLTGRIVIAIWNQTNFHFPINKSTIKGVLIFCDVIIGFRFSRDFMSGKKVQKWQFEHFKKRSFVFKKK